MAGVPGQVVDPRVQRLHVFHGAMGRKAEGRQRVPGHAAHGRDIAEIGGHALPSDLPPGREVQVEVHAFHEGVGRQQGRHAGRGSYGRGVIADPQQDARIRLGQPVADTPDHLEFAGKTRAFLTMLHGSSPCRTALRHALSSA